MGHVPGDVFYVKPRYPPEVLCGPVAPPSIFHIFGKEVFKHPTHSSQVNICISANLLIRIGYIVLQPRYPPEVLCGPVAPPSIFHIFGKEVFKHPTPLCRSVNLL